LEAGRYKGKSDQMAKDKKAAQENAARFAYAKPKAYDAEAEALRLEFEPLDLTDYERAELGEALRLRLGTNGDQIASRAILTRLRQDLADQVRDRVDEAAALANAKAGREDDAWRIIDRDGLDQLCINGRITRAQRDAGLAYRKRYEAAFKGLRSTLGTQSTAITPTIDEMVRGRTRLAKQEIERITVEMVIANASPTALLLLRAIAGEGRSLNNALVTTVPSELAGSSATMRKAVSPDRSAKAYAKAIDLLVIALDICSLRLR
jgi:hypothetical protein